MKKLTLDALAVDSFATIARGGGIRGTVAGRENTGTGACPEDTDPAVCPESHAITCILSGCIPCDSAPC